MTTNAPKTRAEDQKRINDAIAQADAVALLNREFPDKPARTTLIKPRTVSNA